MIMGTRNMKEISIDYHLRDYASPLSARTSVIY